MDLKQLRLLRNFENGAITWFINVFPCFKPLSNALAVI
jgi:hypothetical protein